MSSGGDAGDLETGEEGYKSEAMLTEGCEGLNRNDEVVDGDNVVGDMAGSETDSKVESIEFSV